MIPFLDESLEMHSRGEYSAPLLVAYIVKYLSLGGEQEDFDKLPEWLKERIRERLARYKIVGDWSVFASNGIDEDHSPYADDVIQRFRL